jgi:pyruvate dehydrogenase (quinone)
LCPDAVGDATLAPVSPEAVVGMAVYTAGAMLHGKGHDVSEMMVENIP